MNKTLPARPHLEQLKKQAKELLKNYKSNDDETLARIRAHLPRLAEKSDAEIAKERFVLQDAQHVLAREYGFADWDELAAAIQVTFEVMQHFTDREVQILLREVDQKDFVVALSGASEALREKFLGNMSERVRGFIVEEINQLGALRAEEVEAVQLRMMVQAAQLGKKGQLVWPPKTKEKKAATQVAKKPTKAELEQTERIAQTSKKRLYEISYDGINRLFVDMAETARSEGILALEKVGDGMADEYLKMAIQLVVDGTEPALIMDMLETWKKSLLHEQETKYIKVIEGIMAMQAGDNPRIIEHKLSMIF